MDVFSFILRIHTEKRHLTRPLHRHPVLERTSLGQEQKFGALTRWPEALSVYICVADRSRVPSTPTTQVINQATAETTEIDPYHGRSK
jgi:hypothetical protein